MNNTVFLISTALVTGIISVIPYTWIFARLYCKPRKIETKRTPLDYGLPAELIEFFSQGIRLEGWIIRNNLHLKTGGLVILTHGWSTNSSLLLPLAKFLFNAGFDLLLYDCRGHGNSAKDGPITLRKMAQDVSAAITYVYQDLKTLYSNVSVIGHSMGASAAIVAASYDHRINRLVACSPFSDPKTLTTRHLKQKRIPMGILIHLVYIFIERWLGTTMQNIAPLNRIKHVNQDILLIHGTKDHIIPSSDSASLSAVNQSDKLRFLKIENRGHFDILRDSTFMQVVVDFMSGKDDSMNDSHRIDSTKTNIVIQR